MHLFTRSLQSFKRGCSSDYVTHLQAKWALVWSSLKQLKCQIVKSQPCCSEVGPLPNPCIFLLLSCLTHSSVSNLFLSYSHCCLPLSPTCPSSSSLSLPLPLPLLSHYRSLVSWPGLVLTVLVSIRRLPLGCGPACAWSNGTEICSRFSLRPWRDFRQSVSAPDVEFPSWKPTTICLLSIRHGTHGISIASLNFSLRMCVVEML